MGELPSPTAEIVCELLLSPDLTGKTEISKSSYGITQELTEGSRTEQVEVRFSVAWLFRVCIEVIRIVAPPACLVFSRAECVRLKTLGNHRI
jgi:hypothetical protein